MHKKTKFILHFICFLQMGGFLPPILFLLVMFVIFIHYIFFVNFIKFI